MPTLEREAWRLRVRGRVQGVGFRPRVYRLARHLNLRGWVCNDNDGVLIHLDTNKASFEMFWSQLLHGTGAALIASSKSEPAANEDSPDFRIRGAVEKDATTLQTRVPNDRALCAACQAELFDTKSRRYRHPFATCVDCGPRFSVIEAMPYERDLTSLHRFTMCAACRAEYETTEDRRCRAESIACPQCGPKLTFTEPATNRCCTDWEAVHTAAEILRAGKILALKGLGGYQHLVRADDDDAVLRLRQRKHRPTKPFGVMVRSILDAEKIAHLSRAERELLSSPENSIVVLSVKSADRNVCPTVAPHLTQIGLFLPTTPVHALILSLVDFPLVATSGNQSEEPIAIDESERAGLASIADAFLEHDRPIARRVDDSVIRVIDEQPMMLRLARGYAPYPLTALERFAAGSETQIPPMLAVGGQQKVTFALWTGRQAVLSPHLGDMDHPEARRAFQIAVDDLARLYRCEPRVLIGDMHPDYFTTRWAQAQRKLFLQVQHHHAHAVACMVDQGTLKQEMHAVIWDGTGMGADGAIWGGEILRVSMHDFQRVAALDLFALPGGEAAIHETSRIALSLLAETYRPTAIPDWLIERLGFTAERSRGLVQVIIESLTHPAPAASAGSSTALRHCSCRYVTFPTREKPRVAWKHSLTATKNRRIPSPRGRTPMA